MTPEQTHNGEIIRAEPGALARPIAPIGIQRRMRELGRLRMGDKDDRGYPRKLAKWRVTSAARDLVEAVAKRYGGEVTEWKGAPDEGMWQVYTEASELKILIPRTLDDFGRPSFAYSQMYEHWTGGGCKRRCDGQTEMLGDRPCICDPDNRECKITTRASVMLPDIPSLGVWRLETHGYYAATEIPGILDLLAAASNSGVAVPATLRLEKRQVKRPDPKNPDKMVTLKFVVPAIDLEYSLAEMAPQLMAFNAPALPPAGKPELAAGPDMPDDPSFHKTPDFGSAPDDDGFAPFEPAPGSEDEPPAPAPAPTPAAAPPADDAAQLDLDSLDVGKLRNKIFAQFTQHQLGTKERKALVKLRYGFDSFKDLQEHADKLADLSKHLTYATSEELAGEIASATEKG